MSESQAPYGEPRRRTVDPSVHLLAHSFVLGLLQEAKQVDPVPDGVRAVLETESLRNELVDRAAGAMQQAIEDELEAIARDLQLPGH